MTSCLSQNGFNSKGKMGEIAQVRKTAARGGPGTVSRHSGSSTSLPAQLAGLSCRLLPPGARVAATCPAASCRQHCAQAARSPWNVSVLGKGGKPSRHVSVARTTMRAHPPVTLGNTRGMAAVTLTWGRASFQTQMAADT